MSAEWRWRVLVVELLLEHLQVTRDRCDAFQKRIDELKRAFE